MTETGGRGYFQCGGQGDRAPDELCEGASPER